MPFAVFEATNFLLFLRHESAVTFQIDSNRVSNSKLKLDLCSFVKTKVIESTAPPQWPHKRVQLFGTPCRFRNLQANFLSSFIKMREPTCFKMDFNMSTIKWYIWQYHYTGILEAFAFQTGIVLLYSPCQLI